jgi:hypothetical protein
MKNKWRTHIDLNFQTLEWESTQEVAPDNSCRGKALWSRTFANLELPFKYHRKYIQRHAQIELSSKPISL